MPFLAHLVSTGAGPFYDGAAHFFLTFEELLPVIALAFYAGLRGTRAARWSVVLIASAWLVGGLTGFRFFNVPEQVSSILMFFPGILLAMDWKAADSITFLIMIVFGFALGIFNGSAMVEAGNRFLSVIGALSSAALIMVFGSAFAVSLSTGWTRIALRVAGSWVAAIALLAFGWALRK